MSDINSIIKQIENIGETSKTVSDVKRYIKAIFSEITEEEKQEIMKRLTIRRIKYTEKQKANLMNINYFIVGIKCKTEKEIEKIFKERKTETKRKKAEVKKERKRKEKEEDERKIKENIEDKKEELTAEEEAELKKKFKGKSIDETKKIIKNNKDPKTMNIVKKFWRAIGILAVTSGLIRAIWTRAQKDAKNKRVYDTEQGVDSTKNDTIAKITITPPPTDKFTIEKLQQSIAQEKLQGVSYENIMTTVENIPNLKTKTQIMDLLEAGNIVGIQEFYGMKKTSEYTSNKATGILDKNTLHKMQNPLLGLVGQEITNNANIPNDVKEIYQEFLNGQISNDNLAYLILSKKTCKEYLFDKDNKLIDIQTILIGADIGNKGEFMPYDHYKVTGGKKIYIKGAKINRNTPTGLFKVKKTIELSSDYKIDGPKRGINIVPIDAQGNEEVRFKYTQWGLAIHPIYQQPSNPKKYENAMKSASIQDNSITHGCPNIEGFGTAFDNLELWSKVVICTE